MGLRSVNTPLLMPSPVWNSPKRRIPSKASRMIMSDHQSPIALRKPPGNVVLPRKPIFMRPRICRIVTC